MSASALLLAALESADAGWQVFPCTPTGSHAKAPLTGHGHLDASRDPDVIREWWGKWPTAMIGAPVPESLVVLDIDPRNGGSFAALEHAAGPVPPTLTCWSGRGDGGRHLYYLRPAGELTGTNLPQGIDLKASGYCILPPSIHPASGRPYQWEIREPARLTPRMREMLRPRRRVAQVAQVALSKGGEGLIRLVGSLKDGARNRGLFWAACRAAEDGILSQIEDQLVSAAIDTGLTEREARQTVASATRAVGGRR
jgi:hypothetical protein